MMRIRPPKLTAEQIKAKRDLPVFFTLEGHLRALDGWIDSLETEPKTTYLVVCAFSVEPTSLLGVSSSLVRAKEIGGAHCEHDEKYPLCDTLIYALEDGKDYDYGSMPVVWKNGEDVTS